MNKEIYGLDLDFSFRKVTPDDEELLKQFLCEEGAIADFIHNESIDSDRDVTYIFIDNTENNIVCYCSICCNGITVIETNGIDYKYNTNIPSAEIDFFAIDERYRSIRLEKKSSRYDTLSKAFFLYMIEHIRKISKNEIGASHICLYAVPKAVNFYKRCGFSEFEPYMIQDNKPFVEGCIPMFFKL